LSNIFMEILENSVYFIFYGSIFWTLCEKIQRDIPGFCTKLGCPLCSAIGSILSKITSRYVLIDECVIISRERKIETIYRLI